MTRATLTRVERAILEVLHSSPDEEVPARELRGLLQNRGFRRTAPSLVFTMMQLQDKGLVTCREEVRSLDGVEWTERYYRTTRNPPAD
jgi:hypothetical protein